MKILRWLALGLSLAITAGAIADSVVPARLRLQALRVGTGGTVPASGSVSVSGTVTAATGTFTALTANGNAVCQSTGTNCPASATPGSPSASIQLNNGAGAFAGDADLTWNSASNILDLGSGTQIDANAASGTLLFTQNGTPMFEMLSTGVFNVRAASGLTSSAAIQTLGGASFVANSSARFFTDTAAVANPGYTNINDTDTGMYIVAGNVNQVGLACGGVDCGIVRATQAGAFVGRSIICTTACTITSLAVGDRAVIKKNNSTSRNTTTTPTVDPDLQFTTTSGHLYRVSFCLRFLNATTTTQGMRFFLGQTSAGTSVGTFKYIANTNGTTATALTTWSVTGGSSQNFTDVTTSSGDWVCGEGYLNSNLAGQGVFWSQNTSSGNNTTLLADSFLEFERIG